MGEGDKGVVVPGCPGVPEAGQYVQFLDHLADDVLLGAVERLNVISPQQTQSPQKSPR
jgi:hypothetical protein